MDEVIEKVLKRASYDTEVNLSVKDAIYIDYDRFPIPSHAEAAVLEIRVTNGKRYGYSSTTDLARWSQCLRNATKVMRVSKPLELEPLLPSRQRYAPQPFSRKLWSMGYDDIRESFDRMFDTKLGIISANIAKTNGEDIVANSNGVYSSSKSADFSASIEVKCKGVSSFELKIDKKPFDAGIVLSNAEEFCMKSVNPKAVRTMVTDVVLDYFALSSLITSILLPAFYADRVQSKESFLSDKIGQRIFSDALTVYDDGTAGLFSGQCDHEGVKAQKKTLISKGTVSGLLYDSYSGQKEDKSSTGNCISLSKRPSIGPTNLIVKPGSSEIDTSDCLFVRSLSGVHTSNPVSGEFSVNTDIAFYRGRAVKHAMISGNIFDLFSRIGLIGKKSRQDGVVKCPAIRFEKVQVIA